MRRHPLLLAALAVACGGGTRTAPTPTPPPVVAPPPEVPAVPPVPAEVKPVFPDEPFRSERPQAGPPRAMHLPKMEMFKLPNGVQVYLIERHELPTLTLDLVFDGGSIDDPKGKAGLSSLCAATLDDGTEKLEKIAFEEALADMSSSVYAWSGQDQRGIGLATLKKYAGPTLDLWADVVLHAGLRQVDFDRNAKQTIVAIAQAKKAPRGAAARVADGVLYGPDHVYAGVSTKESIEAIKLADCKKWMKDYIRPTGAKLFVVGDTTRQEIETEMARLAKWKGKPKAANKVGKAKPRKGRIFFVDTPGATQAQIQVMHLGPPRKAPDYFATRLLSSVLGGGFSSRINMNLREAKGWAYGARGGFTYTRSTGAFVATASVRVDATKGSIIEIKKEIDGVISADVGADELDREKNGLMLGLPGEFASGAQALGQYRNLIYYDLPLDYYDHFIEQVSSVTVSAVRAAAQKHLAPGEAKLLVVGDAQVILPMLDELVKEGVFGTDAIVKLDADGNVLK